MDETEDQQREQQLDQLVADYIEARERGERVDVERWLLEHAEFMAELREFLRGYGNAWTKEEQ